MAYMIELVLDTREGDLQVALKTTGIAFTVEQLMIGDIAFRRDGQNVLLLERKTLRDLASSLSDARYKEQKMRLIEYSQANNFPILYIFESFNPESYTTYLEKTPDTTRRPDYSTLISCLLHTTVRDRIFTYVTRDLLDTVDVLRRIWRCMEKYPGQFNGRIIGSREGNDEWVDHVKIKKAANNDPQTCYIMQLATIPGISRIAAKEIAGIYPSWRTLIAAFEKYEPPVTGVRVKKQQPRGHMLKDVLVGERKLGPKNSQQIYDYLFYGEMK